MSKVSFVQKAAKPEASHRDWTILIVDDDAEVHHVTTLALRGLQFRGGGISCLSAHSAAEAREILAQRSDIAIVLLDVVMETDDAGLQLVHYIRETLGNHFVRIILRTGQPGQAPEERVIVNYDINDYKAKTELTAQKLMTTTLTALRSYNDIITLEHHRRGLHRIIEVTDSLFRIQSMEQFASAVLEQLGALLGVGDDGILCIQRRHDSERDIYVLAASPQYGLSYHTPLNKGVLPNEIQEALGQSLRERESFFGGEFCVFYLGDVQEQETVAYLHCAPPTDPVLRDLVSLFCTKMTMGFNNLELFSELTRANADLERKVAERTAELERLARTDSLTGIANRRTFMAELEREIGRAERSGESFALVYFDIDHFKAVNDSHGHQVGDVVLRVTVERVAHILRAVDTFGRMGGEEFAVLLPETDSVGVGVTAERMRTAVADLPMEAGEISVAITSSFGVATYQSGDTGSALIARADAALYRAKEAGRNQVVHAEVTAAGGTA